MALKYFLFIFFAGILFSSPVFSQVQDTLPKFSVNNVGNHRIILGWVNQYEQVKQISIQRGFDSLGAFKTILSVVDPSAKQNGFVDTKAQNDRMYYRLFIVFEGGNYIFSAAKRPVWDTTRVTSPTPEDKRNDTAAVIARTEPPIIKKPDWIPSPYVYTNKEGYVFINLPDADQKKYTIKVFEETGDLLFEIRNIREPALTLDKANFYHAGWFNFELYNDEKLVEKNKFYLARVF